MRVNEIGQCSAAIELNAEEVKILFGSYEKIDYRDKICKHTIHRLLKSALPSTLLPFNSKQVLIEVMPNGGGCLFYFTKIGTKHTKSTVALILNSIDDLISLTKHLKSTELKPFKSTLYRNGCDYYLVLTTSISIRETKHVLSEFGTLKQLNSTEMGFIEERFDKIITSNALNMLYRIV